jgi:hypothetical protein
MKSPTIKERDDNLKRNKTKKWIIIWFLLFYTVYKISLTIYYRDGYEKQTFYGEETLD